MRRHGQQPRTATTHASTRPCKKHLTAETEDPADNPYESECLGGCGVCRACDPPRPGLSGLPMSRMYLCATCGNKRCPAAQDCLKWKCSHSNSSSQVPVLRETGDDR